MIIFLELMPFFIFHLFCIRGHSPRTSRSEGGGGGPKTGQSGTEIQRGDHPFSGHLGQAGTRGGGVNKIAIFCGTSQVNGPLEVPENQRFLQIYFLKTPQNLKFGT